jgi:hypothetical protein
MEGLVLEYTPAADLTGPATVTVSLAGEIIAAESPDLLDPEARDVFAAKVCDGRPGIDLEGLRGELLKLAAKVAGTAGFSPEANAVETRLDAALQDGPAGLFKDTELLDALASLAVTDAAAYSGLRVTLAGAKVRMRDFDRAMKRLIEAAIREQPPELWRNAQGGFFEYDGQICRTKLTAFAPVTVPLCNFTASIVDETTRDDGQERRVVLGIQGKLASGAALPRTEVSAEAFAKMEWLVPAWGSDAIIWPGEYRSLPSAIQALSQTANKERRTVYVHTGWREHSGAWCYIHGGGAVGLPSGVTGISVDLQPPLTRFILPDLVTGDAAAAAVRSSLSLLDLAELRLMVPVLAAVYRAPLGSCDFGLHVAGPSGVFKSEAAALAQQHFGPEMDARHLPGSWSSTANSLELAAFLSKDAIFVVDDFAPAGGGPDLQRLHREAERLFRAQGNQTGRQRMTADGRIRQAKPPRGLIFSTGEEIPRGQSLRARLLILEVGPGDIDKTKLTECQRDAAAGLYAVAMACYLNWLAPAYPRIRAALPELTAKLRSEAAADGMHARTPGVVASLAVGLRLFLLFAETIGAITPDERARLRSESWQALLAAADLQAVKQETTEPARHFVRLLAAVFASQRGHVAGIDGGAPEAPARWGWRKHSFNSFVEFLPQGRRIGWTDGESLYIEPDAAYSECQRLAAEQNESLAVAPVTLRRRLAEHGMLLSTDENRQTLLFRKTVEGTRRNVLHMAARILDCEPDHGNPTTETRPNQNPTTENPGKHGKNQGLVGLVGLENTYPTVSQMNSNERESGEF